MKYLELIDNISDYQMINNNNVEINGIAFDSREVQNGNLFIAISGGSFDGHNYISEAIKKGASAIVAEKNIKEYSSKVSYVVVPNSRKAMGKIAAAFYNYPTRDIKLIGVTGTSGKTTVTHLISYILNQANIKNGVIGTIGIRIDNEYLPSNHTTPESLDLQKTIFNMKHQGVQAVIMEASSHGLYQGRLIGCEFDVGIFTNIARDHLDFHKTQEAYLQAKMLLFNDMPNHSEKTFSGVINIDDEHSDVVIKNTKGKVITFGINKTADLMAKNIIATDKEVSFDLIYENNTINIKMPIGGMFNVYNALSAIGASLCLDIHIDDIIKGLANVKPVAGRFEYVDCGQNFGVIVDYAHTPDELENVLLSAKSITKGNLIVVFGCGGDRDRGKRPIMGRIADEISDIVVVTSDNPRTEDPLSIIDEILTGIERKNNIVVEPDRYKAIREAIKLAKADDCVVIAGKGHEDYQIFANETIHFDDREVARELLMETISYESN
ncbi:MAG: UDP-N-acetylmuramoyl-L-alanyl-D-glutamate--2,6-diaminopimelate ligase [Armatimonadota bacterium]